MKKTARRKVRRTGTKRAARRAPAKARVAAVPTGFHAVTASLVVQGAAQAIDFYKRALGARELNRMISPGSDKIMHAELRIGDSIVFLTDEFPDMGKRSPKALGGATGSLHVYVKNVDAAVRRAVEAGAEVRMPVADMFWGDRYAQVADPFGHEWGLATHTEDLTPREIAKRAEAFFAQQRTS